MNLLVGKVCLSHHNAVNTSDLPALKFSIQFIKDSSATLACFAIFDVTNKAHVRVIVNDAPIPGNEMR